jgi:hypothetical protein
MSGTLELVCFFCFFFGQPEFLKFVLLLYLYVCNRGYEWALELSEEVELFPGFPNVMAMPDHSKCSMPLLLCLFAEYIKENKVKPRLSGTLTIEALDLALPPREGLNKGKTKVDFGFKSNGLLLLGKGKKGTKKKKRMTLDCFVPKDWSFRNFVTGVVVHNTIDCDKIISFKNFISDHLKELDDLYDSILEDPAIVEKPVYTKKNALAHNPSESDDDGDDDDDDDNNNGDDEDGDGTSKHRVRGKSYNQRTTKVISVLKAAFGDVTNGEDDVSLAGTNEISTEELQVLLNELFSRKIVRKITFHDGHLKEFIDNALKDDSVKSLTKLSERAESILAAGKGSKGKKKRASDDNTETSPSRKRKKKSPEK